MREEGVDNSFQACHRFLILQFSLGIERVVRVIQAHHIRIDMNTKQFERLTSMP